MPAATEIATGQGPTGKTCLSSDPRRGSGPSRREKWLL